MAPKLDKKLSHEGSIETMFGETRGRNIDKYRVYGLAQQGHRSAMPGYSFGPFDRARDLLFGLLLGYAKILWANSYQ